MNITVSVLDTNGSPQADAIISLNCAVKGVGKQVNETNLTLTLGAALDVDLAANVLFVTVRSSLLRTEIFQASLVGTAWLTDNPAVAVVSGGDSVSFTAVIGSVDFAPIVKFKGLKVMDNPQALYVEDSGGGNWVYHGGQMGIEPILEALKSGAQLIICGRAYDPSPFAAAGVFHGFDEGMAYHMGKVLECGALCSEPGTTKDCMMGVLYEDCFEVYPTNSQRKCTTVSVAAHTFYEKDHPYILRGPGIVLNLENCEFIDVGKGRVRVSGSRISTTPIYEIKLEGARKVAYRTFVVAGIRDPLLVEKVEEVEEEVKNSVINQYSEIPRDRYEINIYNYGKNGVMGDLEPHNVAGHEIGVMFEVIAKTQSEASALCSSVRSTFMHYGYEGRKSTAGNLAFPFAPSDVEFGAVYEFSVYHLMETVNGKALFPIEYTMR